MPRPTDLTPADTSSTVAPALAAALRRYHADVDEVVVEPEPDAASIAAVRGARVGARTSSSSARSTPIDFDRSSTSSRPIAATATPTIAVAMRGPWDVAAYPPGATALATYSILPGSLDALAAVLTGEAPATGRLPTVIERPVRADA